MRGRLLPIDGSVPDVSEHITIDDSYTGHVTPGAAAQRRDIGTATITKLSVGPMDNNAYLLRCSATGASLLIDAANEAGRLLGVVDAGAPDGLDLIVTTHQHPDHWQALAEVARATKAPTAAHALDAGPLPVTPDRLLAHDEVITLGDLAIDVVHLRGHTPGSVALAVTGADGRKHLFTGDSLFPGGVGKTWSAPDFTSLLDDVTTRLFDRFDDTTTFYPGHGDDSTIGVQRPHLAQWRERGW